MHLDHIAIGVIEKIWLHPATARFQSLWNFAFKREDWQVDIRTENTMTCDAENFYLHRKLRATEGANRTDVLTKEWSQTIPRGHL